MNEMKSLTLGGKTYNSFVDTTARSAVTQKEISYYSTTREEIGINHEDINTDYIWSLYDILIEEHPDKVQKKAHTNNNGTFTNYEYIISTGEYSTDGLYAEAYGSDPHIKKPKYLILSGIHGTERKTTLSTYRFIRDILNGHNVPQAFHEGAIISVMPVGTPSAFNAFTRQSDEAVDINRNFNWNWEADTRKDENGNIFTYGESAASEKETQAITNWLSANTDAELFIDFHNSGMLNEKVVVMGSPDDSNIDTAKKVALRGIDRIIPFWKDVIGYPDKVVASKQGVVEERDVIYSYSASVDGGGMAFAYAYKVLGIHSIAIETCVYYGDYYEYKANETTYQPEVIAMGAEALGNILIEFYTQSCEVNMMSRINDKLTALLNQVNSGFHIIKGAETVDTMLPVSSSATAKLETGFTINNFPADAKLVILEADEDTYAAIMAKTDRAYTIGVTCNFADQVTGSERNCISTTNAKGTMSYGGLAATNTDGVFNTECYAILAGTYRWTAYCWND